MEKMSAAGRKLVEMWIFSGSNSLLYGEREGKSRTKDEKCKEGRMDGTNRETKWAAEVFPWSGLVSKEGIKGSRGSKWELEGRRTAGEGQTKLLRGRRGGWTGLKSEVNEAKRCDGFVKNVGVIAELAWRWQRAVPLPPSSSQGVLHKSSR